MTDLHGDLAENAVEEICYRLFGPDLLIRSPILLEQTGSKELTDILAIVDDIAIIVQSKSIAVEASDLDQTKFGRIRKRHTRAKQQLNTTLNAHARNAEVRASTALGVDFTIDWSRIRHKIGLITLSIPDAAYLDPEFRFQYPYLVESHKGIHVHTFLLRDLHRMASELTTPADVLLYLRARQRCAESGNFSIGNELDLLAYYKTRYPDIEKALTDPACHIIITTGYWEGYHQKHRDKIKDRAKRFQNSILIDNLISHLRTSVEYSTQEYGVSPQESALNYLSLIGKLNKLTWMERAKIGDKLLEKVEKTKTEKFGYFTYVSTLMDIAYLFLFLNEEDRDKRKAFLCYLCEQACHLAPCSGLVGIVTKGAQQGDNSTDAIVMDAQIVRAETKPDQDFKMFEQPVFRSMTEWDS